jgi:hypothetical protein
MVKHLMLLQLMDHFCHCLKQEVCPQLESKLELHVIAFGSESNNQQLQQIARASGKGKVHTSAGTDHSFPTSLWRAKKMLLDSY